MRRKLSISIVLVVLAVVGGVLAATTATGKSGIHVVVGGLNKAKVFDAGNDGLGLGDRIVARGALLNETRTERLGSAYLQCLVHKRIVDGDTGLWNCNYVLELADGDLVLQGLDPRGPGVYEISVLGGTGAYAGASGDATFTDVGEDADTYTDMVIRLK